MLQAPTNDRKTKAEASSKTAEYLPEYEQSSQLMGGIGRSRQSRPLQQRSSLAALQKTYGNQAVRRMSREERGRYPANTNQDRLLQRKRACGSATGLSGICTECQGKQEAILQRYTGGIDATDKAPKIVHEVINSPGQPLPPEVRVLMESELKHDFRRVRIHTDTKAAKSAKAVNALAYTVKQDIIFGADKYTPSTLEGKKLLAHELTHVAQQSQFTNSLPENLTIGSTDDAAEQEADRIANNLTSNRTSNSTSRMSNFESEQGQLAKQRTFSTRPLMVAKPSSLQRTVRVNPPAASNDILNQFNFICPGNFSLTGTQSITANCSTSSTGCECLCDAASDPVREYAIDVQSAIASTKTETLHDGTTAVIPNSTLWPNTLRGQNPIVTMPAPNSSIEFGFFQANSRPVWYPFWRILAHELCGHGRLSQTYSGGTGHRQGHDVTIDTENAIAAEHGSPARGHFADPRQGETFYNPIGDRSRVVFYQVNGTHYEPP